MPEEPINLSAEEWDTFCDLLHRIAYEHQGHWRDAMVQVETEAAARSCDGALAEFVSWDWTEGQ